jgi:hypothetical protein
MQAEDACPTIGATRTFSPRASHRIAHPWRLSATRLLCQTPPALRQFGQESVGARQRLVDLSLQLIAGFKRIIRYELSAAMLTSYALALIFRPDLQRSPADGTRPKKTGCRLLNHFFLPLGARRSAASSR